MNKIKIASLMKYSRPKKMICMKLNSLLILILLRNMNNLFKKTEREINLKREFYNKKIIKTKI